jgi:hypothetical protein
MPSRAGAVLGDAPVEQGEEAVRDHPPLLDAVDGVRRTSSAPRAAAPRPVTRVAGGDPADDGRRPARTGTRLRALLATPRGLRQAVLAAEVLRPPAAARRGGRRRR